VVNDEPGHMLSITQILTLHKHIFSHTNSIYMVFRKKETPFCFSHNLLKWWSIYTKFLPVVAEEILIQNIATKYGNW